MMILHKAGKTHNKSDAMSRIPVAKKLPSTFSQEPIQFDIKFTEQAKEQPDPQQYLPSSRNQDCSTVNLTVWKTPSRSQLIYKNLPSPKDFAIGQNPLEQGLNHSNLWFNP